jgi:hypothetical protein
MNFTFGIITNNCNVNNINNIIDSIERENIPYYEIIIVGGCGVSRKNTTVLRFDENVKESWITKKKNIITNHSKYDNIVYMHDYYILSKGWYKGFLDFGDEWDLCMNKILNKDGKRFRDWCTWDDPELNYIGGKHRVCLPSYDYNKTEYMYISGGYWVAKKSTMLNYYLNETLSWGQGEDVEWSKRVLSDSTYVMNIHSSVSLLKHKNLSAYYK